MSYVINPDKEIVELIREGLRRNKGFCPCKLEKTEDNICKCKEFRETGVCHCMLYLPS
jgi:ferredoxin-thioredoxin reductase catalytic subunit